MPTKAKVNKIALARLSMRYLVKSLTREEKLCILTDMFCPIRDGVRWWGGNGFGVAALDQGIYGHVTTLRRVADVWQKLEALHCNMVEEQTAIRDMLLLELADQDKEEILGVTSGMPDDEMPEPTVKREPQSVNPQTGADPRQLKLAVNQSPPSKYAPPEADSTGYSL
jgi:hypothetical protein